MEDDNKLSYFFLGLGLGVAVGVLFAPKSGAETRDFLRSKADEGTDFVKRRAEDLRDTAADTIDRSKDTHPAPQGEFVGGGGRRQTGVPRSGQDAAGRIETGRPARERRARARVIWITRQYFLH